MDAWSEGMPIVFYDGYYFLAGAGNFLFSKTIKKGCGPLPACRSAGTFVKRPGRHIYHSPPSSAKVKNEWRHTSAPTECLHGMDRNNFALYCLPIFLVMALALWQHSSLSWSGPAYCGTRQGVTWRPESVPYLHFSAKIAVFSKLPLRRLSHVKPRPQKRTYIKAPPLGVYRIISHALKGSLCYVKITHTFGVSSFSFVHSVGQITQRKHSSRYSQKPMCILYPGLGDFTPPCLLHFWSKFFVLVLHPHAFCISDHHTFLDRIVFFI